VNFAALVPLVPPVWGNSAHQSLPAVLSGTITLV